MNQINCVYIPRLAIVTHPTIEIDCNRMQYFSHSADMNEFQLLSEESPIKLGKFGASTNQGAWFKLTLEPLIMVWFEKFKVLWIAYNLRFCGIAGARARGRAHLRNRGRAGARFCGRAVLRARGRAVLRCPNWSIIRAEMLFWGLFHLISYGGGLQPKN